MFTIPQPTCPLVNILHFQLQFYLDFIGGSNKANTSDIDFVFLSIVLLFSITYSSCFLSEKVKIEV